MTPRRSSFYPLGAFLLAGAAGCNVAEPGNPGEGGAAECCDAEPVCPVNAHEVDACLTDACFTESTCCNEKLCEPGICDAARCDQNENEVDGCEATIGDAVCRAVDLCGLTIYCQNDFPCLAVPSCDSGDDELTLASCPDGSACYTVDVCGASVDCIDHGQRHGCPREAPAQTEPCNYFQLSCVYETRAIGCFETWLCDDPPEIEAPVPISGWEWQLIDNSCAHDDR